MKLPRMALLMDRPVTRKGPIRKLPQAGKVSAPCQRGRCCQCYTLACDHECHRLEGKRKDKGREDWNGNDL
jgi:hypothetical protein